MEIRLVDAMARLLFHNDAGDGIGDVSIRGAVAKKIAQIVVLAAEKQYPQKGCETGATRPISPRPSAKRYLRAVSLRSWAMGIRGQRSAIRE